MPLQNIRTVLVETSHPGNIGAAARALKNMGLEQLVLVRPALFPHAEATARASGADDLLARAQVVDNLDAALVGCALVMGTSARSRTLARPALDPRQCARRMIELSQYSEVALVFGRERSGLTNDELDRCHYQVHIPANPAYSSLNLAAAVQILAYELRVAGAADEKPQFPTGDTLPASADQMAHFYEHLQQVLIEIGFLNPDNPRQLMRRLRRLFNRAQPDQNEINILRGILTAVQGRKGSSRY